MGMIPTAFVAPKVLRRLNIAAVGLALASATGAVFGMGAYELSGLLTGVPTLGFGLVWAFLLRVPSTVGKSKVRWGWLASIPLAAIDRKSTRLNSSHSTLSRIPSSA